jgi:hypothetical protein
MKNSVDDKKSLIDRERGLPLALANRGIEQ